MADAASLTRSRDERCSALKRFTIAVVGNPNCGKTTLFNALTGARHRVGNWPGVTVERKAGTFRWRDAEINVVDLPGVYGLSVVSAASVDEKIAQQYLVSRQARLIVNIVDASNLERNLYLTSQLIEMRVPTIVALNMLDVARERGIVVDAKALSERLGCPVVPLVASRGEGIERLKDAVYRMGLEPCAPSLDLGYVSEIEGAIAELVPLIAEVADRYGVDARWLAVKLLEEDEDALALAADVAAERLPGLKEEITGRSGEDVDVLIADARYGFANALVQQAVRRPRVAQRTLSDRIDRIVLNDLLSIPIFLAVIYVMFLFTINFANAFVDFFDILVGTFLVDGLGAWLADIGSPAWLITLLAKGVGSGIQTVATFIPIIGFLYLFLSFLEDSGYMARAAFVMDRFMRTVGLPGKSFVPLVIGFGCTVPAVMATRTLEHPRDRLLTVLMAPFISCGARLPVYALFAAAFFPSGGQNLVFALFLIGIGFAVVTGLVLKGTLLRGETQPFVMELPPYHLPTAKGILLRTWDRLKAFLFGAGKVIVGVVVVLSFLNSFGLDGSFGNEDTDRSVLAAIGKAATPIVEPMGIDADNWPATVGLFSGIFAKEAIVGTLDALYGTLDDDRQAAAAASRSFDLWAGVRAAFASVSANLGALGQTLIDPLGVDIGDASSAEAAAAHQGVSASTFGTMAARFDGRLGAFAFLLAVLLYMPCVAAISAIYRETSAAWAAFAAAWTTGLAYSAAVFVYQLGTFARHPAASSLWVGGIVLAFTGAVVALRLLGGRRPQEPIAAAAE